jgi:nitrogen regulatory protein PII
MRALTVTAMKKLEIIVEGEQQGFVVDLLDRAGAGGYTILNNLSGKGTHGVHMGHLMFNDDSVLVMIVTAVSVDLVAPILEGLTPFFNKHMGVVFTSDIQVSRLVKMPSE